MLLPEFIQEIEISTFESPYTYLNRHSCYASLKKPAKQTEKNTWRQNEKQ